MNRIGAALSDGRQLLLIDMVGASVTSIANSLLAFGVISTGLPGRPLGWMALLAAGFAIFDLVAFTVRLPTEIALRIIGTLNILYCLCTFIICIQYRSQIAWFAIAHFSFEILLVLALACWEWRIATRSFPPANGP